MNRQNNDTERLSRGVVAIKEFLEAARTGDALFTCEALLAGTAYETANERLRDALRLGRECVIESFEHAKTNDDTMLAEARLRDIDAALGAAT